MARLLFAPLFLASFAATAASQTVRSTAHAPFPAYETAPRRPLALSPDGARMAALLPGDHRVQLYSLQEDPKAPLRWEAEVVTGLEPGAMAWLDERRLLVTNTLSDSLAVVDVERAVVEEVLAVGDEPLDVVVAGGRIFVACARAPRDPHLDPPGNQMVEGVLQVFETGDFGFAAQVELELVRPRSLVAVGETVFVVPQHSGNRTTVLDARRARRRSDREPSFGAQATAPNSGLFSPVLRAREAVGWSRPHTGVILNEVDAGDPLLPDRDVVAVDVNSLELHEEATIELGSSLFAVEAIGDHLWVAGLRGFNLNRTEPRLAGSAFDNLVIRVEAAPGGNADLVHQLDDIEEARSHAFPVALAGLEQGGRTRIFAAALSGAAVVELDGEDGFVGAVETGELPFGLALDEARGLLHVWCRGPREVWTYALGEAGTGLQRTARTHLGHDPEPPLFARGRRHLYEARDTHGNGSFGCVSCHQFADHDQLAWNLGVPGGGLAPTFAALLEGEGPVVAAETSAMHPVKGPMMTQSLRGLDGTRSLHWRGDRPFLSTFRTVFAGLQGGGGVSLRDMQEMATFLEALRFPPNPRGRQLQDDEQLRRGEALFQGEDPERPEAGQSLEASCVQCHRRFDGLGESPRSGFVFALGQSQVFLAPDLRGVYQREFGELLGFGLGHEGTDADLAAQLRRHPPVEGVPFDRFSDEDREALAVFVRAFDSGEDAWVGTQWNLESLGLEEGWFKNLAEFRASRTRGGRPSFDAVMKLWQQGEDGSVRRWGATLDDAGEGAVRFLLDDGSTATEAQLLESVAAGARGFVLLVPAGNGRRLGIDRDEDGLLDGTEIEAGSDPAHPDSDRDGYSDGQEIAFGGRLLQPDERLAADVDPPRVLSCRVIGRFASTATLDVVTDEPCSVEVEVGPAGERARRVVSFPLRRHHQIALEGLSAGRTNRYALRLVDRSGNSADEPVVGEFDAGPLALHVGAMEMLVDAGSPRTVVRVVDQDGRPAAGLPVRVLWHLASGRDPRASAADRVAVAVTSQDGEAEFRLDRLELPAGRVSVTLTVLGLGSEDPEHPWFAGRRGETPRFFYEQPLNVTNAVSVLLL